MKSDFLIAVTQLAAERNLPRDMVLSAVEAALVSAYKKSGAPATAEIKVNLDPSTGDVSVFQLKTVVETIEDEDTELTLAQAKKLQRVGSPQLGDVIEFEMEPQEAGRIEAQTAKQVVIQRLREAERELVFTEFAEKEGEVFTGTVQRSEARYGGPVTIDLNGRAEAVLPHDEQSPYDRYRPGVKAKIMILSVDRTSRGPEIIVTRAHPDLLRRLFEMEVPEIYNGVVEIRGISREAGSRSKVAVFAKQEGVDPVGACVGLRGIRIQNIVNELQGEKIDVIQWSRDPAVFLSNALSPAQPLKVEINELEQTASVVVQDRQLSLAIGRDGQNARLAAKLCGLKVDIKSSTEVEIERMKQDIEGEVAKQEANTQVPVVEENIILQTAELSLPDAPLTPIEGEDLEDLAENAKLPSLELEVEDSIEDQSTSEDLLPELSDAKSVEEILALESLDLEDSESLQVETEVLEEINGNAEEDIWVVPDLNTSPSSGLRFAEDILDNDDGASRGTGRRRTKKKPNNRGNR